MDHPMSPLEESPRAVLPGKTKCLQRPAVEMVDFHETPSFHSPMRWSKSIRLYFSVQTCLRRAGRVTGGLRFLLHPLPASLSAYLVACFPLSNQPFVCAFSARTKETYRLTTFRAELRRLGPTYRRYALFAEGTTSAMGECRCYASDEHSYLTPCFLAQA